MFCCLSCALASRAGGLRAIGRPGAGVHFRIVGTTRASGPRVFSMLTTLLATLVLATASNAQHPGGGAVPAEQSPIDAVAVRGTAELTSAAAYGAAHVAAVDHQKAQWRERADRVVSDHRPFWMPRSLVDRAVDRWIAVQAGEHSLRVVDREDREREHEFGKSYQTTLWICEDRAQVTRGEKALRRELEQVRRRTVVLAGGTVGLWAVLAFAVSWIDRLSRGYMTGRLRALGLLIGVAVPSLAFLL